MRVVPDLTALQRGQPAIVTIGAFDGVHRGHQFLISRVVERARQVEGSAIVVTFDPRPQVVLRPGSRQLTGGVEKARLIADLRPDVLVQVPFTREFAAVSAGRFLTTLLEHVNLAEIWLGADFAFGHNREGNVDFLRERGAESGFAVHVVERQSFDGEAISSTLIREQVSAGQVAKAAALLGHHYRVAGPVVAGAGRGADLGFPTANVATDPLQLLPATGIYAARVEIEKVFHDAAVSVGYNLQFGGQEVVVEAFVLDFAADLRGTAIAIDFVDRVRDERRFESVPALIEAMHEDVRTVRTMLAGVPQSS